MRQIDADALIEELEFCETMIAQIADFDESVTKARIEGPRMALAIVKSYANNQTEEQP